MGLAWLTFRNSPSKYLMSKIQDVICCSINQKEPFCRKKKLTIIWYINELIRKTSFVKVGSVVNWKSAVNSFVSEKTLIFYINEFSRVWTFKMQSCNLTIQKVIPWTVTSELTNFSERTKKNFFCDRNRFIIDTPMNFLRQVFF